MNKLMNCKKNKWLNAGVSLNNLANYPHLPFHFFRGLKRNEGKFIHFFSKFMLECNADLIKQIPKYGISYTLKLFTKKDFKMSKQLILFLCDCLTERAFHH